MILDGTDRDGEVFDADVCVIGAGAAGLTLALDLAKRGLSVTLVESGGLTFTEQAQSLLEVDLAENTRIDKGMATRARFFGGTTNLWGGVCIPLDPFEFEQHSWVPNSGWPFGRSELEPFYQAAADLLGLDTVEAVYDPEAMGGAGRPPLINPNQDLVDHTYFRRLPKGRRRMGQWRRPEVEANDLIRCVLNTTVVELFPDQPRNKIVRVKGRTFSGDTLQFRAREFVLCTSAIENARLLLCSDSVVSGGLGNTHDLVGRYFMIHPPIGAGLVVPYDPEAKRTQEEHISNKSQIGWQISAAARQRYQLQAFHLFMRKGSDWADPVRHESAVRALAGAPGLPAEGELPIRRRRFQANWEQSPSPDSRVTLSTRRDALGVRRALVDIDIIREDFLRAQKSFELIALAVARTGRARLFISDITQMSLMGGGGHQIGTTRMSDDPKRGVTDANGKVHSLDNLYIAGSSLFPTGGWQNPTYTIVALALRLSQFLQDRRD